MGSAVTLDSQRTFQSRRSGRKLMAAGVLAIAALLVLLQWRSWQSFDWTTFFSEIRGLNWMLLGVAVISSLVTIPLKAWRWQIFLRPMCHAKSSDVMQPTVVGFTALALFGRPGELLRPYMIARRTSLSMTSQMGVWTVERLFDMGAFGIMAVVTFLFASRLPDLRPFQTAAYITAAVTFAMTIAAIIACRWRETIFSRLQRRVRPDSAPAALVCKARAFADGLNTIKDLRSLVELWLLSFAIWTITALAYVATLDAYPPLHSVSIFPAVILMGCSMVGGLIQLPAVGGGAQLATIAAMVSIFHFHRELAVSAGILLWLVSFHAITPIGLLMARRAHLSLSYASRSLSEEGAAADDYAEPSAQVPADTPLTAEPCGLLQCESEG